MTNLNLNLAIEIKDIMTCWNISLFTKLFRFLIHITVMSISVRMLSLSL